MIKLSIRTSSALCAWRKNRVLFSIHIPLNKAAQPANGYVLTAAVVVSNWGDTNHAQRNTNLWGAFCSWRYRYLSKLLKNHGGFQWKSTPFQSLKNPIFFSDLEFCGRNHGGMIFSEPWSHGPNGGESPGSSHSRLCWLYFRTTPLLDIQGNS